MEIHAWRCIQEILLKDIYMLFALKSHFRKYRQVTKSRRFGKYSLVVGRVGGNRSSNTSVTICLWEASKYFLVRRQFKLCEVNCEKTAFPFHTSQGKEKVEMIVKCYSYKCFSHTFFCV